MSFTAVSEIINKKFGRSNFSKNVTAALVCEGFDKILIEMWSEKMENLAKAMYLKEKVLFVACLAPTVAQEIKMREREIIRRMEIKFGVEVVRGIRLIT